MGISFKVSKIGKRVHPKPLQSDVASSHADEDQQNDAVIATSKKKKKNSDAFSFSNRNLTGEASENKGIVEISNNEVSFTLSLFPDGYSVAKPYENESGRQGPIDIPKFLHPYDRASETLFSAIEAGRLPGDILDDIPCKFIDGTLVCEVRDYRKCSSEGGFTAASGDGPAIINKVPLRMSLENVVKDIPAISDDGWTYGDLMEVESRILKALQPQLCLDPTPQLHRLSGNPAPAKLNLELRSMRRKRLRQIPEVAVSSNNIHGKKVCLDRVPENSRLEGSLMQQPAYENLSVQNNVANTMLPLRNNSFSSDGSLLAVSNQTKYQVEVGSPRMIKDQRSGSLLNASVASPSGQDMMIPFADNSVHGKRENQDGQSSPLTNKKARLTHAGPDGNLQHLGPQMENLNASDLHWKNTLMQQQRGVQYANNGMQKFSPQMFEGGLNQETGQMPFTIGQQGIRYNVKDEPVEEKPGQMSELANIDSQQSRLQQRMSHHLMRPNYPQVPWNNLVDNSSRKEDSFQKRKPVQSPRVSAGGLPQSPLSSKSGEFSSGSIGHQFGAAVNSGLVSSQKEKSAVTSLPSSVNVGGNPSFTSNTNESMQRHNQAQATAKRRTNSLPKTPAISGVGSPISVGNMSVPISANSPTVGSQPLGDQIMIERFSQIKVVSMRFQLNRKRTKTNENPIRKSNSFSAQYLLDRLSNDSNNETMKDETCKMPLSKSLVGGNMNVCKTRILNFTQTEPIQGNGYQFVPKGRTRMIMSEKPNDGTVAFHIGEIEDAEYLSAEDYLPTLPNTHIADLLAAQFSSLMAREGYHVEDHIQPKPVRINHPSGSQMNAPPGSEMQQFSEGVSGQQLCNDMSKPSNSGNNTPINSPHNLQGQRMLPAGNNSQAIQISQGLLPGVSMPSRPPQPDQLQQMQQQHSQFQRSPMMLQANSVQHLNNIAQNANMQLGSHMGNKQLQMLQQQQPQLLQQQQQQAMQRKMMPNSLGNVSMGNIGNNMVGLGGLSNVMGMGGVRGMGGTGISAPMGGISSIGNMNQNAMNLTSASNLSNAIRSGTLTPAQAAFMKMRFAQRSNMMGSPQSSIGAMPGGGGGGGRQMHPSSASLSMLGPALNRANINQIQRTPMGQMGQMGPPKMMPGMNLYMNQQQQLQQQQQQMQLQQQQQLQMQQQQQQQLQQQQQETTSPLQGVLSPPQVGSPSSMSISHQQQLQQQQASPQQISQRTPMSPQLSSGAIHMSAGNPEACPASPQLSSQTMGSVSSITNSPMDLQGVNKSN